MKNNAKEHTLTINSPDFANQPIYANDIVKRNDDDSHMGRIKTTVQDSTANQIVVITDNTITQFPTGNIKVGDNNIILDVNSTDSVSNVTLEPTHEENYVNYWTNPKRIMSIKQIKNSLIYKTII